MGCSWLGEFEWKYCRPLNSGKIHIVADRPQLLRIPGRIACVCGLVTHRNRDLVVLRFVRAFLKSRFVHQRHVAFDHPVVERVIAAELGLTP